MAIYAMSSTTMAIYAIYPTNKAHPMTFPRESFPVKWSVPRAMGWEGWNEEKFKSGKNDGEGKKVAYLAVQTRPLR